MTELQRHLPKDQSAAAIRASLHSLRDERGEAEMRIADQSKQRTKLLSTGTEKEVRAAEASIHDARLTIERIDVLVAELTPQLAKAVEREAGEVRAEQIRDAAASITKFNRWLESEYEAHAVAISAGVELEKEAWRKREALRQSGVPTEVLPAISSTYVGNEARALQNLARLPAIKPGRGIIWP